MKKRSLLIGIVALSLLLSACTQPGADSDSSGITITDEHRGVADESLNNGLFDAGPTIYWTNNERISAALTAYGSGSCPSKPVKLTVVSDTHVVLKMKEYQGACTADLAAYTTAFKVPANVSRTKTVQFSLKFSYPQKPTQIKLKLNPTLDAAVSTKLK
jgi:hypothetical protein